MNKALTSALTAATVISITLGLSGCAPVPSWMEWAQGGKPCQLVSILPKASSLPVGALSRGDNRVLTISELGSSCGVMPENMELIDIRDVGVVFTATVPEATDNSNIARELKWIDVPVFIALLDRNGNIVDRRDYEFSMTINRERTWSRQRVAYPLPPQVQPGDPNYRVIVGLNRPQPKRTSNDCEHKKHHKKHKHAKHGKKAKKEAKISDSSKAEVAANSPSKIPQSPTIDESHKMESNDAKTETGSHDTQNFGMTKVG